MDPSSDSPPRKEGTSSSGAQDYDVVLSYNGKGAEQFFADHLYEALARSGLGIFKDDDIDSRERISSSQIQKARAQSRITIIVFPADFTSLWFLQELVRIVECSRTFGFLVVPVFYYAYPKIRHEREIIAAPFATQEQQFKVEMDETNNWGEVLREALDLTGFVFPTNTDIDDSIKIQHFVDFIKDGLKRKDISLWSGTECQLMNSGLSKLPENMNFPALRKLFLQDNYDLSEIPLSFFEFMPTLQVLDMSRTNIKYLPPSISNLAELQKLSLRGCKLLMELPPEIRALKNLVVFDLAGTELIYIPTEIEMLSELEHLEVSLCACADEYISEIKENGEIIPRKTLSKLLNLKELSIFVDPDCEWWHTEVEAVIQDLFSLEKLETVKLYFPTVELLQKFLQLPRVEFQCLSNFRLIVGRHDQGIISRVPPDLQDRFEILEKCLEYVNGEGNIDGIGQALKHARALFLDRHWTIDQLSIFKADKMDKLRFCLLVECNEMITVIDGGDDGDKSNGGKPLLGLLQYLSIHYMKNLESILVGPLASGCLYHLQILALHTCPMLTTIFNIGLLSNLVNLKELIVEDCPKVKSLVTVESSHLKSGEKFLPSLEKISLLHLPGLVSISSGLCVAPRLQSIVVYNCPKLQSLSPAEMSSIDIEEIKGEREWWEGLEWKSNQPDYLHRVFVPFRRDGLMNQLAEARNTHNTLSMIQNTSKNQELSQAPKFGYWQSEGKSEQASKYVPSYLEKASTCRNVPRFGSWESGDYPYDYTPYFEKARGIRRSRSRLRPATHDDENERSEAPKLDNWESEDVPHADYFKDIQESELPVARTIPGTPGRSRFRSRPAAYDYENLDGSGPTVPKFGDWEENDPTSADGFTQVFELVRDDRNSAGKELNRVRKKEKWFRKGGGFFCLWGGK